MWGFQNFRDSVSSGILRRSGSEEKRQEDARVSQKDAMKNVVTPKSIPKFTLPPLLNNDFMPQTGDTPDEEPSGGSHSFAGSPKLQTRSNTLRVPQLDFYGRHDAISVGEPSSVGLKKSNGSASSLSLKAIIQRKKSDSRPNSPSMKFEGNRNGDSHRDSHKVSEGKNRDLSIEYPGMSLQHLVAKKAGFAMLSESPNTRRKESLFFPPDASKRGPMQDLVPKGDYRSSGSEDNNSSSRSSPRESPKPSPRRSIFPKSERRRNESGRASRSASSDETAILGCPAPDERQDQQFLKAQKSSSDQDISKRTGHPNPPSIRVCVTYLAHHKRLNVSVLEGKDFIPRHSVYLKVSLLPRHDRGNRTDPIKIEDPNPKIQERFTFDHIELDAIPHMSLKICCKEKSSLIRHADVIGECILALCSIDFKSDGFWATLNSYEEEEAPHLQLSLCYDAMLGCLTLDVLTARNVPKARLGRLPDCFVTLTEELPESKVVRKQTKVVQRSQDPAFHESFLFSICNDAKTTDQLAIVATLYVKDRMKGSAEAIGDATVGQTANNWSGRSQWAQALANEGEPVTCWHPLVNDCSSKETTH